MYGWFFRHLPGATWFRIIISLAIILLLTAVLMIWVFPLVVDYSPWTDSTVGS